MRLLLIACLLVPAWSVAAANPDPPRLVVMLAIDQLRRDRLVDSLPGGLGRIAREGRRYSEGVLDHALTETCPGHATMLSGRHPGAAGMPGNRYVDAERGKRTYCVADRSERGRVHGVPGKKEGRSPENLRVSTLGDWLKDADPRARVFSVSAKDRAAITLGGRHADAAYWLQRSAQPGFTTSRYYREELPPWVRAFNGAQPPRDGFWQGLPDTWTYTARADLPGARSDDFEGESQDQSRTSPHPLRDADPEVFAKNLYGTPFADQVTLDFARALVQEHHLGRGPSTDLLALSLSGTDTVGHLYGPFSQESHDALLRLDEAIGAFLAFLENEVGAGRVLLALSSDHGVLALPEWLAETRSETCPVEGGRIGLISLGAGLTWDLHRRFTWILTRPKDWITIAGSQIGVNRAVAAEQDVPVQEIRDTVERYLESQPGITTVWTPEELQAAPDDPYARLYRNSFDPERSGDLLVQIAPGCLVSPYDEGTSHGTPYEYDRQVPIVFWGAGVVGGEVGGVARTVDIAPTLAGRLGVEAPPNLDGKPLD